MDLYIHLIPTSSIMTSVPATTTTNAAATAATTNAATTAATIMATQLQTQSGDGTQSADAAATTTTSSPAPPPKPPSVDDGYAPTYLPFSPLSPTSNVGTGRNSSNGSSSSGDDRSPDAGATSSNVGTGRKSSNSSNDSGSSGDDRYPDAGATFSKSSSTGVVVGVVFAVVAVVSFVCYYYCSRRRKHGEAARARGAAMVEAEDRRNTVQMETNPLARRRQQAGCGDGDAGGGTAGGGEANYAGYEAPATGMEQDASAGGASAIIYAVPLEDAEDGASAAASGLNINQSSPYYDADPVPSEVIAEAGGSSGAAAAAGFLQPAVVGADYTFSSVLTEAPQPAYSSVLAEAPQPAYSSVLAEAPQPAYSSVLAEAPQPAYVPLTELSQPVQQ